MTHENTARGAENGLVVGSGSGEIEVTRSPVAHATLEDCRGPRHAQTTSAWRARIIAEHALREDAWIRYRARKRAQALTVIACCVAAVAIVVVAL